MNKTAEKLFHLREAALLTIADLETHLVEIARSATNNADDEHDPEGSTLAYERERVRSMLDQTRRAVEHLELAIERTELGTYGICRNCGAQIAEERLEAIPSACVCVVCAAPNMRSQ